MEPTPQEEVLIARNNETGQVGAVAGINDDGTPKLTDVRSSKISDLIKFSKGQNPLEAFLSNFIRQVKNPATFGFFKVPADRYESVGYAMSDFIQDPDKNAEILKDFKVEMPQAQQDHKEEVKESESATASEEKTGETETVKYQKPEPIDANKVNWDDISAKWGLDMSQLSEKDKSNMLHNKKSGLVTLNPTMFGETFELKARLSFRANPDGSVSLRPHFISTEPNLSEEFKGFKFSKEDKEMLEKTGNLGRVVNLTDANGNKVPSFVSIDRETKELVGVHVNSIYVPPSIGVNEFSPKEIGILKSGKQLLKDYTDTKGNTYPVVFQCNAATQSVEFVPRANRLIEIEKKENTVQQTPADGTPGEKQSQEKKNNWTLPDGGIKPIGKWKDYHFSDEQKADYAAGKAVKAEVTDDKGQKATVYVKFNPEKGRPIPYKNDPDQAQSVTPADESKTQMAVNNDGKTNEATKNLKDPLQQGQVSPKNDDQQKQQRKPKGPKV